MNPLKGTFSVVLRCLINACDQKLEWPFATAVAAFHERTHQSGWRCVDGLWLCRRHAHK